MAGTLIEAWTGWSVLPAALATTRLLALFMLAPVFGAGAVSWRIRISLALLLGSVAGSSAAPPPSSSPWVWLILSEFGWGALLGLGLSLFVGGLRYAGELVDLQIGSTELVESDPFSPAGDAPQGPAARLLSGLAVLTVIFAATPGGRMPVLEALLAGFQSVPPGWASLRGFQVDSLTLALDASAELAFRAALPVMSVMAVVTWAQALIARSAPRFSIDALAAAVRPLLGLAVLAMTFGGIADVAGDTLRSWIDLSQQAR